MNKMGVAAFVVAGVVIAGLLTGASSFLLAGSGEDAGPGQDVSLTELRGTGPLDDLVFRARMGPEGMPADVEDHLVFRGGLFVSSECQIRCQYPPRPYFTRSKDGALHFFSETRCPGKDAKIVWRGRIQDGRISGEATWFMERWYWSVERTFWFDGEAVDNAPMLAEAIPLGAD